MTQPIAIVTGGSRGIGRAIVRSLAAAGYQVAFTYQRDHVAAATLLEELRCAYAQASFSAHACDIAEPASIQQCFAEIDNQYPRIDLLVNNAGITRDGLLATMPLADLQLVIQTNLIGTLLCCQQVLPSMLRQRQGCIVNLSSVAAQKPGKGQSNYAAAKGGVEALTRALAVELAPRNIRVNAIAPGIVNTEMSTALVASQAEAIHERLLVKRYAEPEEIAQAVLFIAQAHYLTGEVIALNGGLKMP